MFKELNVSLNVPRVNKNYSYECYQDSLLNAEFSKIPYSNLQSEDCKTTKLDEKRLDEKNLNERNLKEENYKEENLKKDNCTSKNVENEKCSDENLENFNLPKESSNDENLDKVAKREVNSKKEHLNANEDSGIKALVAYIKKNNLQKTMHKGVEDVELLINCDEEGIRDVIKELICNLANKWNEKEKIMNELLGNVKKMNLWNKVFEEDILAIVNEKFSNILKTHNYGYDYDNNVVRNAVTRYSRFLNVLFDNLENKDRDNRIVESVVGHFINGLNEISNDRVFSNVLEFLRNYGENRKDSDIIFNAFKEILYCWWKNNNDLVKIIKDFYKNDKDKLNEIECDIKKLYRKITLKILRMVEEKRNWFPYLGILESGLEANPELREMISSDKEILDKVNSQLEEEMEQVRKDIQNKYRRHTYQVAYFLSLINKIAPSLLEQKEGPYFGEIYYCIDNILNKKNTFPPSNEIKIIGEIKKIVPFVYETWAKMNP